tara:strand:- start:126 stop:494 length:369 start_codon:yes stop_codon:yes gene_type:complete
MSSIGVSLPLVYDQGDGFVMNKTLKRSINQNLKMLILTNPGERVMDPNFGVGVQRYLFANYSDDINSKIRSRINEQVKRYMPGLRIFSVEFYAENPDTNSIAFRIKYTIPDLGTSDLLEFTI